MNEADNGIAEGILDSCRRLVSIVHSASKATEKSLGLSAAQLFVLQKLRDGKSRSVNELAALTHTHQSSVSVVIKKLILKDMIRTVPSTDDGRRHLLVLAAKGRKVLERSSGEGVQDQIMHAISRLAENDGKELERLLNRLIEEMQGSSRPASLFLED